MKSERISPFWVNGYQPFSAPAVFELCGTSVGTADALTGPTSFDFIQQTVFRDCICLRNAWAGGSGSSRRTCLHQPHGCKQESAWEEMFHGSAGFEDLVKNK